MMKYFVIIVTFFALDALSKPSYLLINASTGEKIIAENSDEKRFPASLTKMMTLYITFEKLKDGTLKLTDEVPMSSKACRLPPSKLHLRPGTKLTVEEAIQALAVKSANDVALALAERIGGSEYEFAAMMNEKAEALGMNDTVFYNPSGLPHRKQVSTAEDMAKLAQAHLNHHPEFYYFFSSRHFSFRGKRYKNHNTLLGKIDGVDGLKTGYTPAAGWNLVASQKIGSERIIGVVMGEYSQPRRNYMMTTLLNKQVPTQAQILEAERKVSKKRHRARMALSNWTVQTGTFRNRAQANKFISDLKKKHTSVVSSALNIVRRKRKQYTTQVGQFKSKKEAETMCATLKEKSLTCLVVKTK